MPVPSSLLFASLSICDTLLEDTRDGSFSLIRLLDVFLVMPLQERQKLADEGGKFHIQIKMLAQAKFDLHDDGKHTAKIILIRPDGEVSEASKPLELDLSKLPGVDQGVPEVLWRTVNIRVVMTVTVKQTGRHWFALQIDGEEVSRTVFALLDAPMEIEA